ncbi:MAG TPA: sugar ABC transporter permease [Acidimicrobiia bacterium]|nr:sugar ABC transporter permease [Acidimicrobiia bacterium]
MTRLSTAPPAQGEVEEGPRRGFLKALEIDLRVFGMVVALVLILVGFGMATDGRFLQPVNMVNLAVQSVSVAIIATGMTMVIVARQIDLSVGSIVGVVGMTYAYLMARVLPDIVGFGSPWIWVIALAAGLTLGSLIGALQGFIVAYIGVPSFVVTLGGLLIFRGATWLVTRGVTISPVDPTFQLLGGGPRGSIGGTASWVVGGLSCLAIVALLASGRRQRVRFGFPLRPMWAEALVGTVGSLAVLGLVWLFNSYKWPPALAERHAAETGVAIPPGGLAAGIPWPVVLLLVVTLVMSFVATRRRFGRYVFAIGGNPEASELAGINTKWTIMKTFILIGLLCAVSAAVATARLDGATLDLGEGYELYVIAASVIGGTSFSGGIGTIPGAVLGALVMSSLAYGLSFMGLSSPIQDIFAGIVLIIAVAFDTINRRRKK